MPPPEAALRPPQALALGLLQGPSELLPISSSAHTALAAQLAGWRYEEIDPAARKSFEVALHGGAGLALAVALRGRLARLDRGQLAALALSLLPPALAGLALRGPIERRLGGPRSIAAGLIAGSGAMVAAEVAGGRRSRGCGDARPADALALGVAQAFALAPGVSRSGATLAAARARGFGGEPARALSLLTAMPVLTGAGALDALRLARRGRGSRGADAHRGARVLGGVAAFASTLACVRALGGAQRLLPYAVYRVLLAGAILRRARRGGAR